jgi:hypothetical protein
MRGLRLGLACAAVSAAMVTAAFGAGSASAATQLCKVSTSPCPAASVYASGYTVTPPDLRHRKRPERAREMDPGSKGFLGFEINGNGESGCQYTTKTSFPQSIGGGSTTSASNGALANSAGTGCVSSVSVSMGGFSTPKFFVTN